MATPLKPSTEADYCARIDRVMRAIEADLDRPLDLNALAEIACFSPYHFHRIYRGIAGETIAETVRRLRLHRAATALLKGNAPLEAIARRAGYGGVDAFSRAFSHHYGASPAAYRRGGRRRASDLHKTQENLRMSRHATIETCPPLRLAALAHRGPYEAIGPVFERLAIWAGGRGLLSGAPRMIGVYYDDPTAAPPPDLRSDAAIVIDADFALDASADAPVREIALAGGPHAALRFTGPYAELEPVYTWLYGVWLPSSGREPADAPSYEEYLNDPRETPPADLVTLIRTPLKT